MGALLTWLQNPSNLQIVDHAVTIFAALIGLLLVIFESRKAPDKVKEAPPPEGGRGGNASVAGNGQAIGGKGGRAGDLGNGGHGGNARVEGSGTAIGGDGGEGAHSWRPSLGGNIGLRHLQNESFIKLLPRDEFGLVSVGRGGTGGDPNIKINVSGHELPLVPMLRLLELWEPEALAQLDQHKDQTAQERWLIF